ncbi:hypothetical protein SSX86_002165 [Deinandra increscens subsp. villosa]|uniref:Uncharacterized protein n=1 Tax=Deinandra increscens subsp. villosa TaxID=3103831 RepID=A0AAP0DRV4_9ASTR
MVDEGENKKKATNEYKKQYTRRERKERNIDVKVNEGEIKNNDECEADKRKKNVKEVIADSKKVTKEEEIRRILSSTGDDINKEESDRNKVAETVKSKDVENVRKKEGSKPNLKVKLTKFGGGGKKVPVESKDIGKPGNDKNKSTVEGTNKHVDVDDVAGAKLGKNDTVGSAPALENDEQLALKNIVSNVVRSVEKEHNTTVEDVDGTIVVGEGDASGSKKDGATKETEKSDGDGTIVGGEVDASGSKKDGATKEGNKNIENTTRAENRKRKIQNEDKLKRNQEGNRRVTNKDVNDEETELRNSSTKSTQSKKPKLDQEVEKKKRRSTRGKKQKINQEAENINLVDETESEEDGFEESSHAA